MQLSKRTQYGIRAMICLCDAYDRGFLQTKALAGRERLPIKFLESILSALTRAKLLMSKIGATGGYRLARPPRAIQVAEIIGCLEGHWLLEGNGTQPGDARPGELAVQVLEQQLSQAVYDVLENTSLAALAEQVAQRARGGQMYYI